MPHSKHAAGAASCNAASTLHGPQNPPSTKAFTLTTCKTCPEQQKHIQRVKRIIPNIPWTGILQLPYK